MKFPEGIPVWGDKSFRGKCHIEAVEQVSWFNKIRQEYPDTYGAIATHVRNEGLKENGQFSAVMKHSAEGMTKGCSDIIVPARIPLVIEMKRCDPTRSKITDEQIKYLRAVQAAGGYACIALGAKAAYEAFLWWVGEYGDG